MADKKEVKVLGGLALLAIAAEYAVTSLRLPPHTTVVLQVTFLAAAAFLNGMQWRAASKGRHAGA